MEKLKSKLVNIASDLNVFKKFGEYLFDRFLGNFVTFERKEGNLSCLTLRNLKLIKENINANLAKSLPFQLESGHINFAQFNLPPSLNKILDERKTLNLEGVDIVIGMSPDITHGFLNNLIAVLNQKLNSSDEPSPAADKEEFVKKSFAFLALLRLLTNCRLIITDLVIRIVLWPHLPDSPCLMIRISKLDLDSQSRIDPKNELYTSKIEMKGLSIFMLPTRVVNPLEYLEFHKNPPIFPFSYPVDKHPSCILSVPAPIELLIKNEALQGSRDVVANIPPIEFVLSPVQLKLLVQYANDYLEWNAKATELQTVCDLIAKKKIPCTSDLKNVLKMDMTSSQMEFLRKSMADLEAEKKLDDLEEKSKADIKTEIELIQDNLIVSSESQKKATLRLDIKLKEIQVTFLKNSLPFDPVYRFYHMLPPDSGLSSSTYLPSSAIVLRLEDLSCSMNPGDRLKVQLMDLQVLDIQYESKVVHPPPVPPQPVNVAVTLQQANHIMEQSSLFQSCLDESDVFHSLRQQNSIILGQPSGELSRQHSNLEKSSFFEAKDMLSVSMLNIRMIAGDFLNWTPKPETDHYCINPVVSFHNVEQSKCMKQSQLITIHNRTNEYSHSPNAVLLAIVDLNQDTTTNVDLNLASVQINLTDDFILSLSEIVEPVQGLIQFNQRYAPIFKYVKELEEILKPQESKAPLTHILLTTLKDYYYDIANEINAATFQFIQSLNLKLESPLLDFYFTAYDRQNLPETKCAMCPLPKAFTYNLSLSFLSLNCAFTPNNEAFIIETGLQSLCLSHQCSNNPKPLEIFSSKSEKHTEKAIRLSFSWNPMKKDDSDELNIINPVPITSEYNFDTVWSDSYLKINFASGKKAFDVGRPKFSVDQTKRAHNAVKVTFEQAVNLSFNLEYLEQLFLEVSLLERIVQTHLTGRNSLLKKWEETVIIHEMDGWISGAATNGGGRKQPISRNPSDGDLKPQSPPQSISFALHLFETNAFLENMFALRIKDCRFGYYAKDTLYLFESSIESLNLAYTSKACEQPILKPGIHVSPHWKPTGRYEPEILQADGLRVIGSHCSLSAELQGLVIRPPFLPSFIEDIHKVLELKNKLEILKHEREKGSESNMSKSEIEFSLEKSVGHLWSMAEKKMMTINVNVSNIMVDLFPYMTTNQKDKSLGRMFNQRGIVQIKQIEYNNEGINLASGCFYYLDTSRKGDTINPLFLLDRKSIPLEKLGFTKMVAMEYCCVRFQDNQKVGREGVRMILGPTTLNCCSDLLSSLLSFAYQLKAVVVSELDEFEDLADEYVVIGEDEEVKEDDFIYLTEEEHMKEFDGFIILEDCGNDRRHPVVKLTDDKNHFEKPRLNVDITSFTVRVYDSDTSYGVYDAETYFAGNAPDISKKRPEQAKHTTGTRNCLSFTLEKVVFLQMDKILPVSLQESPESPKAQRLFFSIGSVRLTQNNGDKVTDIIHKYEKKVQNAFNTAFTVLLDNEEPKGRVSIYVAPSNLKVKVTTFFISFIKEFSSKLVTPTNQKLLKQLMKSSTSTLSRKNSDSNKVPSSPSKTVETVIQEFNLREFFLDIDFIKDATLPEGFSTISLVPEQKDIRISFPPIEIDQKEISVDDIVTTVKKRFQSHFLRHQFPGLLWKILVSRKIKYLLTLPLEIFSTTIKKQHGKYSDFLLKPR